MSFDLEAARALCNQATPGPWSWYAEDNSLCWMGQTGNEHENYVMGAYTCKACAENRSKCLRPGKEDADFIAQARTLLPSALDRIAELEEMLVKERARVLFNGPWCSNLPDDCGFDAEMNAAKIEARKQLHSEGKI